MYKYAWLAVMVLLFAVGCSGTGPVENPISDNGSGVALTADNPHQLWGLWQFTADPQMGTLDVTEARTGDIHLNAMHFLEPPVLVYLTVESVHFNGNILDVDIGLRHPFIGLDRYTGFDVCGIFIGNGSATGFDDSGIAMPGKDDTRMLNPDGYSRWWNPAEFPVNTGTMFGYKDGELGTPDATANFTATLNGYKYFCDDLANADDPMSDVTQAHRGMFTAGTKNVRHYTIDLAAGLVFNYAVDASWKLPVGEPPFTIPDDFPPQANRVEAWNVSTTENTNTLWNDGTSNGGGLSMTIDVYDWFNAGLNTITVESPGNFAPSGLISPVGGGVGYSTYQVDITDATPAEGNIDLLISVISEQADFAGFIPGTNVTSYFVHTASVAPEAPTTTAAPVLGNVWLDVVRNPSETTITGVDVSWIDNNEPFFAIYADDDPYDAGENWDYVTEVETTTAQIDISDMPAFATSGAYLFTVRARTVSGDASTESANSEVCFIEMEDFDGGANPNPWTIGYKDASYKWSITPEGQIDGSSSLRIDPHPIGYWSVIISEPLPVIADSALSYIEFAHETTAQSTNSMFTSYCFGDSSTPAPQGVVDTYNDFDGPTDFYVIMDGTYNWVAPATGPPPDNTPGGGWIPLVEYFGWPDDGPAVFYGWRMYDGPHGEPRMTRARHDKYITEAPNVRAGFGYGSSVWTNSQDWGEIDEVAVVIY